MINIHSPMLRFKPGFSPTAVCFVITVTLQYCKGDCGSPLLWWNNSHVVCYLFCSQIAFSALTLLQPTGRKIGRKGIWPVKKLEWWGAGMVICLEPGADLHMAQLMSLPLTVSCFSKIQIGFTFLLPAHPGSPGQGAVKWVCVFAARLTYQ